MSYGARALFICFKDGTRAHARNQYGCFSSRRKGQFGAVKALNGVDLESEPEKRLDLSAITEPASRPSLTVINGVRRTPGLDFLSRSGRNAGFPRHALPACASSSRNCRSAQPDVAENTRLMHAAFGCRLAHQAHD